MRVTLGTNNIDSTARTGYAGAQGFIENIFGQGATANLIPGLSNSDSVFVAGGDPTSVNPILGLQIRACARRGANIFTIGHVHGLRHFSPEELKPALHAEAVLLEGIVTALKARKGLSGANPALEEKITEINTSLADVERIAGVSGRDFTRFVDKLSVSATPSVVVGKELVQSSGGSHKLLLVSAINYLINGRIYLLSERANEQGLLDMGCAPDLLPGYRPLAYAEFRRRYEDAWHTTISGKPGLSVFEMIDSAKKGALKAMYVMGENPVFNLPNSRDVEAALTNIDFLVVQDIFLTETGRLADVVFPSLSWAEKEGTFTNMERRLQRLRKAVDRDGMEDWRIISEISKNMPAKLYYSSTEDVFGDICKVSPLHRDLSYKYMEKSDAIYPYKGEPLRGAPGEIKTHKGGMTRTDGKLCLRLERPLFHSGTLSTRAAALVNIYPQAVARISPSLASSLFLKEGDMVRLSTKAGSLDVPLALDESIDGSVVMLTNNFEGKGAFGLMEYEIDPVTKAPCIDGNQITIEKSVRVESEVKV
jgi:predicted molibdopterin-dependent oxidoreductase YjgC